MTNEPPVDLQPLDPGTTPDVVRAAVRRFRLHVVVFTVVAILGLTAGGTWAVVTVLEARERAEAREMLISAPQRAIAEDLVGHTCRTPTYDLGSMDITLLQVAPMPGGGWALHLVVDGKGAPVAKENISGGDSFPFWTTLDTSGAARGEGRVSAQLGATWGDTYLSVPSSAGRRIAIDVIDAGMDPAGSFVIDLDDVLCR